MSLKRFTNSKHLRGLGRPLLETAMQLCEIAREALEMDGEVGR